MGDTRIRTLAQSTPNPLAYKFLVSEDVKSGGKVTFYSVAECAHVPLARRLMELPYAVQIHMYENFITVTQDGSVAWESVCGDIEGIIREEMQDHVPTFPTAEDVRRASLDPAILKIEEILDDTIRPSLQADGGDIQVMGLQGNSLTVFYEGACGSCPSSTMGTLEAITSILKEKFHPSIQVIPVNQEVL